MSEDIDEIDWSDDVVMPEPTPAPVTEITTLCGHPCPDGWKGWCVLCARDIEIGGNPSKKAVTEPAEPMMDRETAVDALVVEKMMEIKKLKAELAAVRICFAEASHSAGPTTVHVEALERELATSNAERNRWKRGHDAQVECLGWHQTAIKEWKAEVDSLRAQLAEAKSSLISSANGNRCLLAQLAAAQSKLAEAEALIQSLTTKIQNL